MSPKDSLLSITKPSCSGHLSAKEILQGLPISPIKRVMIMEDKEYEEFVGEWLYSCVKKEYFDIFHIGGPGDGGRDFAAYVDSEGIQWDNYQCKHYKKPLSSSDILPEIGKLLYNCFIKRYSYPRTYFFVVIEVSSNSLDLLKNPIRLKEELINRWKDTSEKKITTSKRIELTPELRAFIDQCDFSIFRIITAEKIIDQLHQTVYYAPRFGGGLKVKPRETVIVSKMIKKSEQIYIKKLFNAYSEDENKQISHKDDLKKNEKLLRHLNRQREIYYSAEMLKQFSRDNLPPGSTAFEELKEGIYYSIVPVIESHHCSCKSKIDSTLTVASQIPFEGNALKDELLPQDKQGICHHLANERDDIIWTTK